MECVELGSSGLASYEANTVDYCTGGAMVSGELGGSNGIVYFLTSRPYSVVRSRI